MNQLELQPAPSISLSDGHAIPQLGLGTWPLQGDEAAHAVCTALHVGYRLIDTAENYENEEAVGRGLHQSGVPREQIFLTTKFNRQWHSRAGVHEACRASLKRLQTDYLDLFLIHWPNPEQNRYVEAFQGMAELVQQGLVRSIGVSNFKPAHLERLLAAGLVPVLNQIQLDPYRQRRDAVDFNTRHGIVTESWSPLDRMSGLLAEPAIVAAAQAHQRTTSQIVLRWHIQNRYVCVPKSASETHQRENLSIFDFALTAEEMAALNALYRPTATLLDSDVFGH